MGFFGAMGKALKAPLRPINKAVGAIPGMRGIQSATPGMNAVSNATGVGVQPNQGIGPSPNAMQNIGQAAGGMLGGRNMARPQPAMGANYGATFPTPTPLSSPPPPLDTGYQAPNQPEQQEPMPSAPDMGIARPDVMPQSPGNEAPINQGVGPQPQAMNRMMGRRPRMMRGQM